MYHTPEGPGDIQIQLFLLMFTNRSSLSCVKTLRAWALLQGHLCRGLAGSSNKHLDPEGNLDLSIKFLLCLEEKAWESHRELLRSNWLQGHKLRIRAEAFCQVFNPKFRLLYTHLACVYSWLLLYTQVVSLSLYQGPLILQHFPANWSVYSDLEYGT